MRLTALQVAGFRNLVTQTVEPGARFNVFAGENGQGKTNFLEAVYVSCVLRSFRAQRLSELIQHDCPQASVSSRVEHGGLLRTYEVTIQPGARQARLDGKLVRPIARYFGGFNVVLFAPEDLQIPRGNPSNRRGFLDRAVFGFRSSFLEQAQTFEKSLRTRNALLKEMQGRRTPASTDMLAVYTSQLATYGARLVCARRSYLEVLAPRVTAAFAEIMRIPDEAAVGYDAPWESLDEEELSRELSGALDAALPRDLARGHTTVGPQRDNLLFTLGGRSASAFASQGQLRAMVLAWKTSELDLLEEAIGEPPIMLLDDVSSELDPSRNEYLFHYLRRRPNQCFITTTHPSYVLLDTERQDFRVLSGKISTDNLQCG